MDVRQTDEELSRLTHRLSLIKFLPKRSEILRSASGRSSTPSSVPISSTFPILIRIQGRRHKFRTAGAACPDKGPMAERPKVTYTQNPKTPRIRPIIFQEGPKLCKKMHVPAIF